MCVCVCICICLYIYIYMCVYTCIHMCTRIYYVYIHIYICRYGQLSKGYRSNVTNKIKCSFFLAAGVSILLYRYNTWTLTKRMKKKLDSNYKKKMQRVILNKSCRLLYGHLPPITKTIQVRRTRPAGHGWRSRDVLISDILQWTPSHGRAKAERPAITYIQQICADRRWSLEDLPGAIDDRDQWRGKVREIRAGSET